MAVFYCIFIAPRHHHGWLSHQYKIGALFYNMGHSFVLPAMIMAIGLLTTTPILLMAALIWLAHIFLDRALGYGLKYDDAFKKTHLQQIA